jgi:BMFP domain-containing protein YqiC
MQPSEVIKDIIERLSAIVPPDLQLLKKDLEKNTQAILSNAFAKLDLVTREEFDAQTKVLARTRQKITALEQQIITLEALVK